MSKSKGHVIRISQTVQKYVEEKKGTLSWDAYLRKVFGMPTSGRKRTPQPLAEMWVLPEAGLAYPSQAKARGGAIMEAVRTGNEQERPVRMREVV